MSELLTKYRERDEKTKERKKLLRQVEQLEQERIDFNKTRSEYLDKVKNSYHESTSKSIGLKYQSHISELEYRVKTLTDSLGDINVKEDNEELKILRGKHKYLTDIAENIDRLKYSLERVSNEYFINIARVNKILTYKRFDKEVKNLPRYIKEVDKLKGHELLCITLTNAMTKVTGENISLYASSLLTGFIFAISFPFLFVHLIFKIKKIHYYSIKFNQLVESALSLKDKSEEEISSTIKDIMRIKEESIQEEMKQLMIKIDSINKDKEVEINSIVFDEAEVEETLDKRENEINDRLKKFKKEILIYDEIVSKLDKEVKVLETDDKILKERERNLYVNPNNEDKQVVFPKKFLYDFNERDNIWVPLVSGLYVYERRIDVEKLMRLITYEMRNYMLYESINIYVLDSLMGLALSDMILPRRNNIYIDSMKTAQDSRIQVLHDTMDRRKTIIKSIANDINTYNEIQLATNSAPLSIEIVFYFFESAVNLSEKLIQLFRVGEVLGIYLIVFIDIEFLTEANLKVYERYINNIIEVSSTGVTRNLFGDFKQRLKIDKK